MVEKFCGRGRFCFEPGVKDWGSYGWWEWWAERVRRCGRSRNKQVKHRRTGTVASQNDWGPLYILIVGTRFIEYISSRINVICSYSETWTWQVVRCFPLDQIPLIRSRSMALLVHFPSTELPCPVSLPQRTAATATNRTYTIQWLVYKAFIAAKLKPDIQRVQVVHWF